MSDFEEETIEELKKTVERLETGEFEIVEYSQAPLEHVQNADYEFYLVVDHHG